MGIQYIYVEPQIPPAFRVTPAEKVSPVLDTNCDPFDGQKDPILGEVVPPSPSSPPSPTASKLTLGQWIEAVLARLGFISNRLLQQQQLQLQRTLQKQQKEWNIPLESLSELTYLDSGAQGVVYLGN